MKKSIFILLVVMLALAACGSETPSAAMNGIEVYRARVLLPGGEAMKDMPTSLAGFMVIKNVSQQPDRLISVSADFADASLHETRIVNDVVSMDPVAGIDIPAGQMVELMSASYHVMLVNVKGALKPGDSVTLILHFEKAGDVSVPARVTDQ